MILLLGIPSEPPLARLAAELERLGSRFVCFNQRRFETSRVTLEIGEDRLSGVVSQDGWRCTLADLEGAYVRLMDDQSLPELRGMPDDAPARGQARAVHDVLSRILDVAPGRIVNRLAPMASNGSKPYQMQLIAAAGFSVPETLITNDPDLVRDFCRTHGSIIFKSASGERSIVRKLEDADLGRIESIRGCPVLFQEYVAGVDVRVHTIGDRAFAVAVRSDASDYRYASQFGHDAALLEPIELDEEIGGRCVQLSATLGLAFAGIDLRLRPGGEAVCFEVNPCPGYSYYEAHTGQPIARALARYLAGLD